MNVAQHFGLLMVGDQPLVFLIELTRYGSHLNLGKSRR